uniref:Ribosomal protein s kinase alpha n=1 Tax=Echinococcus granulosus TaxID=6210 RepID=A0A068WZ20_ECHGR|nr:ribosomal protein s kinase alpha [Echinococcus granulosus]
MQSPTLNIVEFIRRECYLVVCKTLPTEGSDMTTAYAMKRFFLQNSAAVRCALREHLNLVRLAPHRHQSPFLPTLFCSSRIHGQPNFVILRANRIEITTKADVWSLALLMAEIVSGPVRPGDSDGAESISSVFPTSYWKTDSGRGILKCEYTQTYKLMGREDTPLDLTVKGHGLHLLLGGFVRFRTKPMGSSVVAGGEAPDLEAASSLFDDGVSTKLCSPPPSLDPLHIYDRHDDKNHHRYLVSD